MGRQERGSKWILHTVGFGRFDAQCLEDLARHISIMVSTLRSTVLTYGEKALTPLPPREKEPVDLWLRASREELQEASQALWAWIMLPPEGGGAEGLEPRGEARQVKLHLRPFAEGALRYAFHLFLQGGKEELHLVVKESKFAGAHASPQKVHSFFLVNHRRAQALAV